MTTWTGQLMRAHPEAIDDLIVRVLRRAHEAADKLNKPNEARVILHIAHSFADELAPLDPQFDRLGFITAATGPAVKARTQRAANSIGDARSGAIETRQPGHRAS